MQINGAWDICSYSYRVMAAGNIRLYNTQRQQTLCPSALSIFQPFPSQYGLSSSLSLFRLPFPEGNLWKSHRILLAKLPRGSSNQIWDSRSKYIWPLSLSLSLSLSLVDHPTKHNIVKANPSVKSHVHASWSDMSIVHRPVAWHISSASPCWVPYCYA